MCHVFSCEEMADQLLESKVVLVEVKDGEKSTNVEIEFNSFLETSDSQQIISILKRKRPLYSRSLESGEYEFKVESSSFPGQLLSVGSYSSIRHEDTVPLSTVSPYGTTVSPYNSGHSLLS